MNSIIQNSLTKLKTFCENEKFQGWDPFDGLNSKFFQALPFISDNKYARLAWIQLFKRNPYNLRNLFLVEKGLNPKGIALFLSGYCKLYSINKSTEILNIIYELANKLIALKSENYSGPCWGYNFDWQAKAFFQPKYTPTVVATTYAGYALLDAYEITGMESYIETAVKIASFISTDLNRSYDNEGNFAFSYSPLDNTQVFNASLLGSRMLSRIFKYNHNKELIDLARKSVNYCCKFQKRDGSWSYGTLPYHQWVDSFHTGFNIECISEYQKFSNDYSFEHNIKAGFEYYINNFFTNEGIPKYYNNSVYPVDVHSTAQLIITLNRMDLLKSFENLASRVLQWTISNMQMPNGYFIYQKNKYYSNNIPYMRWSQSWMFFCLATYLSDLNI